MTPANIIDDVFKKICPLNPRYAEKLWNAYLAGDKKQRDWIETAARTYLKSLVGEDFRHNQLLLPPPTPPTAFGQYPLAWVTYGQMDMGCWFGLDDKDWIQHVAIFGRSGSGKTNLGSLILCQLTKHKKPFLVFDWKRNYRDLKPTLSKLEIYTVGRDVRPFQFNPWIPPKNTPIDTWIKKIVEVAVHAYFAGEGVIDVLLRCLNEAYLQAGSYEGKGYPVTADITRIVQRKIKETARQAQWKASTLRILRSLDFGPMGRTTRATSNNHIEQLLQQNVILELDSLADSDKTFLSEAIMLWILQYRLNKQERREKFRHAIIVEEAHHLFLKRPLNHLGEPITDVMLREIREFGESIVLLDQHPSLITITALGNSNTTICFNLKAEQDIQAAARCLLLDKNDYNFLGKLTIGQAIVKTGRHPEPFSIEIPLITFNKGTVTDEHLKPLPLSRTATKIECSYEEKLLKDVCLHPYTPLLQRYRRLKWNPRTGTMALQQAVKNKWVTPLLITRRKGRQKLLKLTQQGRDHANQLQISHAFPVHFQHTFWRKIIKESLERNGYTVKAEHAVNGYADLVATKNKKHYAIEIETGKSNYLDNITKCLTSNHNFTKVIVVATTRNAALQINAKLQQTGLHNNHKLTLTLARNLDY